MSPMLFTFLLQLFALNLVPSCRQTTESASWDMMTQIQRKRRRNTSQPSRIWWSGSVSLSASLCKFLIWSNLIFGKVFTDQCVCIPQATNLMKSPTHQTTFSSFMTSLWTSFAGQCRQDAFVLINLIWCTELGTDVWFLSTAGVTHTCATRKGRNWRATTFLRRRGETDPSRSPWCCSRGWRRACLPRERRRSGWRWSWRTARWTLWRTESNTRHIIAQEMNGVKTWCFSSLEIQSLSYELCFSDTGFISFSPGASTPPMTTPTVCVIPLNKSHTHCVPKSSRPGRHEAFNSLSHASQTGLHSLVYIDVLWPYSLFCVAGVLHISGCVTLWTCTALCSGSMAAWTSPTLLCPRGKSSNWLRPVLSGNFLFAPKLLFNHLIYISVWSYHRDLSRVDAAACMQQF